MKTSLHKIHTEDNIELVGVLYEPENPTQKVLAHVHGLGGNFYENGFLDHIARTLTDSGIAFFAFNNRGCEFIKDLYKTENGKQEIVRIGNAYERFEDSIFDIRCAVNFLEQQGFSDIHLSGHSLGAPKVSFYLAETQDPRVKSVLLISPADMLGLVRMDEGTFKKDMAEALELKAANQGEKLLSHLLWDDAPISADTYISLFADESKTAIFNFLDPNSTFDTLGKIRIPAFAVMGRKDDALVISIEDTFEKLTKALSSSPKVETKILSDANHGFIGNEQDLADVLKEWLLTI